MQIWEIRQVGAVKCGRKYSLGISKLVAMTACKCYLQDIGDLSVANSNQCGMVVSVNMNHCEMSFELSQDA
jgi:hypothetical protein